MQTLLILLGVGCGLWLMIDGLRTGEVEVRYMTVSRAEAPVLYWIVIGIEALFIVLGIGLALFSLQPH
jgi:hypothetical protein